MSTGFPERNIPYYSPNLDGKNDFAGHLSKVENFVTSKLWKVYTFKRIRKHKNLLSNIFDAITFFQHEKNEMNSFRLVFPS